MLCKAASATLLLSLLFLLFPVTVSAFESDLIAQINSYRQSKGFSVVKTDSFTCNFAKIRAQEISTGFTHFGFNNRISTKTLPYPRYRLITENLAWTPGGQNPIDMWINSPTHEANLLKNTPIVCVERQGDYFAFEGWKP